MKLSEIINIVESKQHSAFFITPPVYSNSFSYLFSDPTEIITISKPEDVYDKFQLIDARIAKGLTGYALINYEAGFLFERKFKKYLKNGTEKLIQFILFEEKNVIQFKSADIEFSATGGYASGRDVYDYSISNFKLNTSPEEFEKNVKRIKNYIRRGDTYQVNYTVKGKFNLSGSYSSFFQHLLFNQSARYSAVINDRDRYVISLSPEKFFSIKENKILSKPMKGTIKRGFNNDSDKLNEQKLISSKKNLAENVMIVDLIRNDLGKIAVYGSVSVPQLFATEKYESLYQMVSKITAELRNGTTIGKVVQNIFPCGSITGAPKIRTMEIINELEKDERGIYTGSIGVYSKKKANFNVAIRTLTINKNNGDGELGIGAGIVWDSDAKKEYEETLVKSKFLTNPDNYFELFETMLVENQEILFFKEHVERLKLSSDFFLFNFDEGNIRKSIYNKVAEFNFREKYKLKLILNKWGKIKIETSEFSPITNNVKIIISEKRINTQNRYQYFKTTNRNLYDKEYQKYSAKGFYDVIFLNEKDEVAEGSITNIFIRQGNEWFTPPSISGILNGIYRSYLLQTTGKAAEKVILVDELLDAHEIKIVNSVRGEVAIKQLYYWDRVINL